MIRIRRSFFLQASLCVRRAVYTDPETGKEDPAKKGICSNFLCDAKPGQEITMTGGWVGG